MQPGGQYRLDEPPQQHTFDGRVEPPTDPLAAELQERGILSPSPLAAYPATEPGVQGAEPPASLDTTTDKSASSAAAWENRQLHLFERQRQELLFALRHSGQGRKAERVEACSTRAYVAQRECGKGRPSLVVERCGVKGCPRCQKFEAREASEELSRHVTAVQRFFGKRHKAKRHRMLHVVLTSRTGTNAGQHLDPETLRRNGHHVMKAAGQLYQKTLRFIGGKKGPRGGRRANPNVGLVVNLEFDPEHAMAHAHCIWFGPWLDQEWLSRQWEELTGWRIVHVNRPYYYKTEQDRREGRKSYDNPAKACKEVAKYLCAANKLTPKATMRHAGNARQVSLPALAAVAVNRMRTSRTYGVFYGDPLERALLATRDSSSNVCPHCKRDDCGTRRTPTMPLLDALAVADVELSQFLGRAPPDQLRRLAHVSDVLPAVVRELARRRRRSGLLVSK